jgi:UDP-2-acetamido-2,6-beta-L-arabino-hexul-4-ose reductase
MKLEVKQDNRGILVEVFKNPGFGQIHYITSKPGVIRGKHYHTRKIEQFCVIKGKAELKLKDIKTRANFVYEVSGKTPEIINVPINTVHEIKNTGKEEMICLVWNSEVFDPKDPDTIPYIECSICHNEISDEDYHKYGSQCTYCRMRGWSDV